MFNPSKVLKFHDKVSPHIDSCRILRNKDFTIDLLATSVFFDDSHFDPLGAFGPLGALGPSGAFGPFGRCGASEMLS